MIIKSEDKMWYDQYFRQFRDSAPQEISKWCGYSEGLPTAMASSLESCLAFSKIVEDSNATILNAGAGLSSWILRKMFKNVICTDPDDRYLKAVQTVCVAGGLSGNNFITGLSNVPNCDYCYYDYGNSERVPSLLTAMNKTKYKLYADDTDDRECCIPYRKYIYTFAQEHSLNIEDCRDAIDEHGRWGVILSYKLNTIHN